MAGFSFSGHPPVGRIHRSGKRTCAGKTPEDGHFRRFTKLRSDLPVPVHQGLLFIRSRQEILRAEFIHQHGVIFSNYLKIPAEGCSVRPGFDGCVYYRGEVSLYKW